MALSVIAWGAASLMMDWVFYWQFMAKAAVLVMSVPFLMKFVLMGAMTFKAMMLMYYWDDEQTFEMKLLRFSDRPWWFQFVLVLIWLSWAFTMYQYALCLNLWNG